LRSRCVAWLDYLRSGNVYKVISQAQEDLYNAKVQEVKDEHEKRLQQAFEVAKVSFSDDWMIFFLIHVE
jgi:hypothetical protein